MYGINEIDADQLQQLLADGEEQVELIDVRSPMEVAQGAIPGARHIPLHLLPLQLNQLPTDRKVIFYCRTGARSGQACLFAGGQGWQNTINLRGGIVAWVQRGHAIA